MIGQSIFELESGNRNVDGQTNGQKKQTNERTELHQFRKEPSYDGDLSPCFELETGNGNFDRFRVRVRKQKCWTNGQKNGRNYTNFERNLAMMVIYLPVKFEFDWTNRFRVRVRKQKCGRTDGCRTHQSNRRAGYTQPA